MEIEIVEQEIMHASDGDVLPDRNTGWKNLVFCKDGASSYGRQTWSTARAAKEAADACDAEIKALYSKGELARIMTLDGPVCVDDYNYTIQVPHP